MKFTCNLSCDYLVKTKGKFENDGDFVRNEKLLESAINELLLKCLVVDNYHSYLAHAIAYLKNHHNSMIGVLANLASFNKEALHNCKISKCSNIGKPYKESNLFFILLNARNEDMLKI